MPSKRRQGESGYAYAMRRRRESFLGDPKNLRELPEGAPRWIDSICNVCGRGMKALNKVRPELHRCERCRKRRRGKRDAESTLERLAKKPRF